MGQHLVTTTLQITQIADELRASGVSPEVVRRWLAKAILELLEGSQEPMQGFVPPTPHPVPKVQEEPPARAEAPKVAFFPTAPKESLVQHPDGIVVKTTVGKPSEEVPLPDPVASMAVDRAVQSVLGGVDPPEKPQEGLEAKGIKVDNLDYHCVEDILRDQGVPESLITAGHQRGIARVALKSIRAKLLGRYVMRHTNHGSDVNYFGGPALDILRDTVANWIAMNRKKFPKTPTPFPHVSAGATVGDQSDLGNLFNA